MKRLKNTLKKIPIYMDDASLRPFIYIAKASDISENEICCANKDEIDSNNKHRLIIGTSKTITKNDILYRYILEFNSDDILLETFYEDSLKKKELLKSSSFGTFENTYDIKSDVGDIL